MSYRHARMSCRSKSRAGTSALRMSRASRFHLSLYLLLSHTSSISISILISPFHRLSKVKCYARESSIRAQACATSHLHFSYHRRMERVPASAFGKAQCSAASCSFSVFCSTYWASGRAATSPNTPTKCCCLPQSKASNRWYQSGIEHRRV
jgi:hypothetical protein